MAALIDDGDDHRPGEIEQCARCGGRVKVIASIEEPETDSPPNCPRGAASTARSTRNRARGYEYLRSSRTWRGPQLAHFGRQGAPDLIGLAVGQLRRQQLEYGAHDRLEVGFTDRGRLVNSGAPASTRLGPLSWIDSPLPIT